MQGWYEDDDMARDACLGFVVVMACFAAAAFVVWMRGGG